MDQDPCDVIHELIVVSRELLRLGDTGQEVAPSKVCVMLRRRRDLLQTEMRTQLCAVAGLSAEMAPRGADPESVTVRPPVSGTRFKASARATGSPIPIRAQRKERP
jgi:hypothetical protein